MRKTIWLTTLFVCLLMAGCAGTQNTAEMEALQSQVEELQKQLDILQAEPETDTPPLGQGDNSATMSRETSAGSDAVERGTTESSAADDSVESYDIAGLETAVNSIVVKISTATVSGDARTDRSAFRELHNELESVDNQLDQMENLIEADFRDGILPRSDYLELDRQLDALDDRLGRAKDILEFTFGVDD